MSRRIRNANKHTKAPVPTARAKGGAPRRADDGNESFGLAERLLLGMAPPDAIDTLAGTLDGVRSAGRSAARVALVKDFLARNPEMRAELAKEAAETWKRVRGSHAAFSAAIVERRAQLLSRAQLANFNEGAPVAAANAQREVARYLAELEGISGG